jgi:hypothetical protein
MKKADRGVLRREICASVKAIYSSILDRRDERRKREWEAFAVSDLVHLFADLYSPTGLVLAHVRANFQCRAEMVYQG